MSLAVSLPLVSVQFVQLVRYIILLLLNLNVTVPPTNSF